MPNILNLKKGVAESGDIRNSIAAYSADGAIDVRNHTAILTKGSAAAMTLRAPVAAEDGTEVEIISSTAYAHTITCATIGFNDAGASGDVCTFSAAKGNNLTVVAYNGKWYVTTNINGTLA